MSLLAARFRGAVSHRRAAVLALWTALGAVLAWAAIPEAPARFVPLGAFFGLLLGLLMLAHSRLRVRWGTATAWALVALGGALVFLPLVPFSDECSSVSSCARLAAVYSLVGVLFIAAAASLSAVWFVLRLWVSATGPLVRRLAGFVTGSARNASGSGRDAIGRSRKSSQKPTRKRTSTASRGPRPDSKSSRKGRSAP